MEGENLGEDVDLDATFLVSVDLDEQLFYLLLRLVGGLLVHHLLQLLLLLLLLAFLSHHCQKR